MAVVRVAILIVVGLLSPSVFLLGGDGGGASGRS